MPLPMNAAAGAGGGAAAAAAIKRMKEEEEEQMTPYSPDDLGQYEFKIIRSTTGQFRKPEVFRAMLEEEGKAGWELVEKFDQSRVRLKRRLDRRRNDAELGFDPYRTYYGMGEGKLVVLVLVCIFGGLFAFFGLMALLSQKH